MCSQAKIQFITNLESVGRRISPSLVKIGFPQLRPRSKMSKPNFYLDNSRFSGEFYSGEHIEFYKILGYSLFHAAEVEIPLCLTPS